MRQPSPLRATGHLRALGIYAFGDDGMPTSFHADRYRDVGGGRSVLEPFTGECADFRDESGLLVPHRMTALWHVGGAAVPYARFVVDTLDYDETQPF